MKEVTSITGLMGRRMDDNDNKTREGSHIHNWIDGQAHVYPCMDACGTESEFLE